jgi:Protein of unknown function (DUF3750)
MPKPKAKWLLLLPPVLFAIAYVDHDTAGENWRRASRAPVGLAPNPATTREAVVQVYAARAVSWRGYFGVHTWIAAKPTGADRYAVYEVLSWNLRRRGSAVEVSNRAPDARWFGAEPELLADLRGDGADETIARIEAAVADYPYADRYHVWPGPNSNTFTAYVLRAVPELRADMPPTAIGKDYLGADFVARTPSGTGGQLSVFGLFGVLAGLEEGLEVDVLGLTFGIDPNQASIKLPLAGRVGFSGPPEVRAAESSR